MSDQKVSNERRRELTQIDPFQASLLKAMDYAKEYKKQLIFIAGAVVLVAVVVASVPGTRARQPSRGWLWIAQVP